MCNAQKMGQVRTVLKKVPTDFKSRLQRKQDTFANPSSDPSALLTVGLQPTLFQEFGSALGGGKHVSFAEEASLKAEKPNVFWDLVMHFPARRRLLVHPQGAPHKG